MKTESEELFEKACGKYGFPVRRIAEGDERRPDYEVCPSGIKIIVEVKQIDVNDEEKNLLQEMESGKIVSFRNKSGARVRSKIKSSSKQIANLAKGKYPGILALYDNTPFAVGSHLESYNIKSGMYGLEQYILNRPANVDDPINVIDARFGPKRKMTMEHNTSISAIAVLSRAEDQVELCLYHNCFSAIPLGFKIFLECGIPQYCISQKRNREFQEWELVCG
jgi:hypothetical protein